MNAADVIAALDLPASARVDVRVPKKSLVENGAPTAADKRRINDGIEEIAWLAALKPATIGVPAYRDEAREYLEIAVLRMTMRPGAKATRLVELLHRAVPYPVLLVAVQLTRVSISLVHKRWSEGQSGAVVLDGEPVSAHLYNVSSPELLRHFLEALSLAQQPRRTLYELYDGWANTVIALHVAQITGTFSVTTNAERQAIRREALEACLRLEARIEMLRGTADRERQPSRQVHLNLELKRVQAEYAAARARL